MDDSGLQFDIAGGNEFTQHSLGWEGLTGSDHLTQHAAQRGGDRVGPGPTFWCRRKGVETPNHNV